MLTATQSLDDTTLSLFEHKGRENAVKLRRVLQAITDLTGRPFHELRVLDTGCGEGIYAIELGLHGAEVVAIDARTTRMDAGRECAARLGLERVSFHQLDVRQLSTADLGTFDVVLCLGLLYHLSAADIPPVLQSLHRLCRHGLILDTHVALESGHARPLSDMQSIEAGGLLLKGRWYQEHGAGDSTEVRYSRAKASLDNEQSFWPTRQSLVELLQHAGFTSVSVQEAPLEPGKPLDRLTLTAVRGTPVRLCGYPWLNSAENECSQDQQAADCVTASAAASTANGTAESARIAALYQQLVELSGQVRAEVDQLPGPPERGVKIGYKFVADADEHVGRHIGGFRLLDPAPASSVLEIGAGCGWLLALCRELRGCRVQGFDISVDRLVVYRRMRDLLGLTEAVREHRVTAHQPVPFNGKWDAIVSLLTMFDVEWDVAAHEFWLADCLTHLNPGGTLLMGFNRITLQNDEVMELYRSHGTFVRPSTARITAPE